MLPGKRGLGAAAAAKEAPRTLVWKALGFWPPLSSVYPGCLGELMLIPTRPSTLQILLISHDQIFFILLLETFEVVMTDAATSDGFFMVTKL